MEIRVEQRLTGRALHERILQRYGSRARLEEAASEPGAHEAQDDLLTVELLEEEPRRLEEEMRLETIAVLEPGELARFTEKRLQLLETLSRAPEPLNLTELAQRVGRDPKNVSEDLEVLSGLGLVRRTRRGREKVAEPEGTEIRIVLRDGATA